MPQAAHRKTQRRSLLDEATAQLQRHHRQSHGHLHEYLQSVQRYLSEVQHEVQSQQVAIESFRHELSQSLAEGSGRFGASEHSSENQQLRHEREHLG